VGRIQRHYQRLAAFDEAMKEQKRQEEETRRRKQMVQRLWNVVTEWVALG
jgi:hypothetical protein